MDIAFERLKELYPGFEKPESGLCIYPRFHTNNESHWVMVYPNAISFHFPAGVETYYHMTEYDEELFNLWFERAKRDVPVV